MKQKIIIQTVIILLTAASCKKPETGPEGQQGPQGNPGPALSGNLKGYINHFDASGAKVTTDLANDSVFIDGTSMATVTDANGMFSFSGLNTGVYNVTVRKTGSSYGYTRIQNIEFAGNGDTYRNGSISMIPTTSVSTFTAYDTIINSVNYIKLRGTVTLSSKAQSIVVFVNSPGITGASPNNYSTNYMINIVPAATVFTKNIPTSDLYDLGFTSGNTSYFTACMIGSNSQASAYVDFTTNRTIYTALSASSVTAQAPVQ
jgi:hypothetical protein